MAILYTNLAGGIFAFTMDVYYPFSATKEVAKFIKNQGMEKILVVGDVDYYDYAGPPLSAYLEQKVYYLGSQKPGFGSFLVWDNKRSHTSRQEVYEFFDKIGELSKVKATDILLVLSHKLNTCRHEKEGRLIKGEQLKFENYCFEFKNLYFSKVSEFTNNIISDENPGFYLYLIPHKQKT